MTKRFRHPNQGDQYDSEYDLPSEEIWDIQNRGVSPIKSIPAASINLAVAGFLRINEPGTGFEFTCIDNATGLNFTDALINVFVNSKDGSDITRRFPAKPFRGFNGAFQALYLQWPAQVASTYTVNFTLFKSDKAPWQGGNESS